MISSNAGAAADDLMEEISQFEEQVEEEKDRALKEAQDLAKQRVPVADGDLRDDISVDLDNDRLYNTLEYAIYQNYGTEHMEGTMYLTDSARDAFQNSIDRLQS